MPRRLLRLSGADTHDFLQGLVTNDVRKLADGPIYAALLTPQGKYIADFFLIADRGDILIDVDDALAAAVKQRLTMYKLRADVSIADADGHLHRGLGPVPADGWADPRHEALGWRAWRDTPQQDDTVDWEALRVAHLVPQSGIELTPDSFILETNFEALHGVDFRKGCYVGQEVTARMKHKTELRKGLAVVDIEGDAQIGDDITTPDGKTAGTLLTRSGGKALAYLRFDRSGPDMTCGNAKVSYPG
ncbi:folate-binding protein [Aliishimia ponticola]|uniref:Folate-binding protein n=1 Tax=Aliishimia ponticola TaxID=2499833 RepID=A0A4S4ND26_9RHOB|nr:folate-binding protein YgfZ [Aliishimia ponticola]THH37319.1 folate-binding protein [Aliishimia ponticola]